MMTNENPDLIIAGVGLALTIIGQVNRQKVGTLAKSGVKVEGVVFSVEPEVDVNSGSQYAIGSSPYPTIRFVTADNEWVMQKYNESAFPGYKAGDKVAVI